MGAGFVTARGSRLPLIEGRLDAVCASEARERRATRRVMVRVVVGRVGRVGFIEEVGGGGVEAEAEDEFGYTFVFVFIGVEGLDIVSV